MSRSLLGTPSDLPSRGDHQHDSRQATHDQQAALSTGRPQPWTRSCWPSCLAVLPRPPGAPVAPRPAGRLPGESRTAARPDVTDAEPVRVWVTTVMASPASRSRARRAARLVSRSALSAAHSLSCFLADVHPRLAARPVPHCRRLPGRPAWPPVQAAMDLRAPDAATEDTKRARHPLNTDRSLVGCQAATAAAWRRHATGQSPQRLRITDGISVIATVGRIVKGSDMILFRCGGARPLSPSFAMSTGVTPDGYRTSDRACRNCSVRRCSR